MHASTKRQLARPGIRRLGNPSLSLYRSRSAPAREADLLSALLAVQSEGSQALADAMSQGLFDRLKRWHAPRLAKSRP